MKKKQKQKKSVRRPVAAPVADRPLSVVILAAGQGKRMNSAQPKVLQTLAGRPLLRYVVNLARELHPADICIVHGHGGDAVRAAFDGEQLRWALQAEQRGTGHAVQQAMPAIPDDHLVLVLYGVGSPGTELEFAL